MALRERLAEWDERYERRYDDRLASTALGRLVQAVQSGSGRHASVGRLAVLALLMLLLAISSFSSGEVFGGSVLVAVAAAFLTLGLLMRRQRGV